jgi:hypothetical protein
VNVILWFGESVAGKLSPLTENPVPLRFAAEIISADPPELVNVSERFELFPFCTLPKESVVGDAANAPLEPPLNPPGDTPPQAVSSAIPAPTESDLIKQRYDRKTPMIPIP